MHDVCKFQGFLAKIQKIILHPIMAHAFDIDGLNLCQVNEVQWEKRFHGDASTLGSNASKMAKHTENQLILGFYN